MLVCVPMRCVHLRSRAFWSDYHYNRGLQHSHVAQFVLPFQVNSLGVVINIQHHQHMCLYNSEQLDTACKAAKLYSSGHSSDARLFSSYTWLSESIVDNHCYNQCYNHCYNPCYNHCYNHVSLGFGNKISYNDLCKQQCSSNLFLSAKVVNQRRMCDLCWCTIPAWTSWPSAAV